MEMPVSNAVHAATAGAPAPAPLPPAGERFPHPGDRIGPPTIVTLRPRHWTPIPGTNLLVRWDGDAEVSVHSGEFWDVPPPVRPGRTQAWARIVDRPALGMWPIIPAEPGTAGRPAGDPGEAW